MARRDRETPISIPELVKAAGSKYENAPEIWAQYVSLKEKGGRARISWSPKTGYHLYEGEGE